MKTMEKQLDKSEVKELAYSSVEKSILIIVGQLEMMERLLDTISKFSPEYQPTLTQEQTKALQLFIKTSKGKLLNLANLYGINYIKI